MWRAKGASLGANTQVLCWPAWALPCRRQLQGGGLCLILGTDWGVWLRDPAAVGTCEAELWAAPCTSVPRVPAHSVALFGKHKGPWYCLRPGQAQQPAPRETPSSGCRVDRRSQDGGEGSEMTEAWQEEKLSLEDSVASDECNSLE